MKRTFVAVVGLGTVIGLGWLLLFGGSTIEFTKEPQVSATSTSAAVEVQPTAAELLEAATLQMIEEAINASSTEIEKAADEAATAVRQQMQREIERGVRASITAEHEAQIEAIDKETGAY